MFNFSEKDEKIFYDRVEKIFGTIERAFNVSTFDNEKEIEILHVPSQKDGCDYYITRGITWDLMEDGSIAELVFPIDPNIDMENSERELGFIYKWINLTYLMSREGKTMKPWTINEETGEASGELPFNGIILLPANENYRVALDNCYIDFLRVEPLYIEEIMYRRENSTEALLLRLSHMLERVSYIDLDRVNSCLGEVKPLKIMPNEVRTIIEDEIAYKSCLASDKIMVEGNKVGVCFRMEPSSPEDSGWVFLSGLESEDELLNLSYKDTYTVEHVLNYDEEVQFLLGSPSETAFRRDEMGIFIEDEVCPERNIILLPSYKDEEKPDDQGDDFVYDGKIHMYKVGAKGLNTKEINGLTHIAIYTRALAEEGYLRCDLDENIRKTMEQAIAQGARFPLREYIRDNYDSCLPYEIFNEEGKLFSRIFMEYEYTQEVDLYTKERFKVDGYKDDPKTEEYLFIPYDEDYYKAMKTWIHKKLEYFNNEILARRKEGKLSEDLRQKISQMIQGKEEGQDIENIEIYTYIIDEMHKLMERGVFTGQEVYGDSEFILEISKFVMMENTFRSMELLLNIVGYSYEDAKKKALGPWFETFGFMFLRRGYSDDAFEMFQTGTKLDPNHLMNWYYLAILALDGRGKKVFENAMNHLSTMGKDNYLVQALIKDLKQGVNDPRQLLLHLSNEKEDADFLEKIKNRDTLSYEELKVVRLAESVTVYNEGIEKIKFILGDDIRKADNGEILIINDTSQYEFVYYFLMSIGAFSVLDLNFIENLNYYLNQENYRILKAYDDNTYILKSVLVDEDGSVALVYSDEQELNNHCSIGLDREILKDNQFPSGEEILVMFNENLAKFNLMYEESNKSITEGNLYS